MIRRIVMLRVVLAIYLYILIKVILFKGKAINLAFMMRQLQVSWHDPAHIVMRMKQGNLTPFHEIARTLNDPTSHGLVNLTGNFAIFVPLGLLQGMLDSQRRLTVIDAAAQSLVLSLTLEVSQAVFSIGAFDADDLILNTCGGLAGFIAYTLYVNLLRLSPVRRTKQLTHSRAKRLQ